MWLGAGAITLGVGAALASGSGVAHADEGVSSPPSSSANDDHRDTSSGLGSNRLHGASVPNRSTQRPDAADVGIRSTTNSRSTSGSRGSKAEVPRHLRKRKASVSSPVVQDNNVTAADASLNEDASEEPRRHNLRKKKASVSSPVVQDNNLTAADASLNEDASEEAQTHNLSKKKAANPASLGPTNNMTATNASLNEDISSTTLSGGLPVFTLFASARSESEAFVASVTHRSSLTVVEFLPPTAARVSTSTSGVTRQALDASIELAPTVTYSDAYLQQFRDADPEGRFYTPGSSDWQPVNGPIYTNQADYDAFVEQSVDQYGTSGFTRDSSNSLVYTNTYNDDVAVLTGPRADIDPQGITIVRPGETKTLPSYDGGTVAQAQLPKSGVGQPRIVAVAAPGHPPATSSGGSGSFGQSPAAQFLRNIGNGLGLLSLVDDGITFIERAQATFQRPLGFLSRGFLPVISAVTNIVGVPQAASDLTSGNPVRIISGGATIVAAAAGAVAAAPIAPPPVRLVAAGVALGANAVNIVTGWFR